MVMRKPFRPGFNPVEKLFFKISGINPNRQMNWKQNMYAMLTINLVWFVIGFILLQTQQWLPLNPDNNPNMSPDLAFNTTISFLVNCNLQHYLVKQESVTSASFS